MAPGTAYTDHQFRSSNHTGPRATPTIPKGGVFSVYAEVSIPTPPHYPYEALLNIRTWREWNSFNPDVIITKHSNPHHRDLRMEQGCFMTVTYQITPDVRKETKSVCMHLEPLKHRNDGKESHKLGGNITRIRWTSDNANLLTPGFYFRSERVNEIEETPDGHTKYRTWLTFDGFSAKSLKKKYEKALMTRLPEFCEDLKERSIKMYKENPSMYKEYAAMHMTKTKSATSAHENKGVQEPVHVHQTSAAVR